MQQDTSTYIRGILTRVASVGCFPGAWRRGSWHFQVASLHLQSSMGLVFDRFTLFFLPEQSEAPCITNKYGDIPVGINVCLHISMKAARIIP